MAEADAPIVRGEHPLKAWRERQRVIDLESKDPRPWSIADASRKYSGFIGRNVSYQVWRAWELHREEAGSRIPNPDDMRGIFAFTNGEVRADHYYETVPAVAGGG